MADGANAGAEETIDMRPIPKADKCCDIWFSQKQDCSIPRLGLKGLVARCRAPLKWLKRDPPVMCRSETLVIPSRKTHKNVLTRWFPIRIDEHRQWSAEGYRWLTTTVTPGQKYETMRWMIMPIFLP
jgi:hypothetical protein